MDSLLSAPLRQSVIVGLVVDSTPKFLAALDEVEHHRSASVRHDLSVPPTALFIEIAPPGTFEEVHLVMRSMTLLGGKTVTVLFGHVDPSLVLPADAFTAVPNAARPPAVQFVQARTSFVVDLKKLRLMQPPADEQSTAAQRMRQLATLSAGVSRDSFLLALDCLRWHPVCARSLAQFEYRVTVRGLNGAFAC